MASLSVSATYCPWLGFLIWFAWHFFFNEFCLGARRPSALSVRVVRFFSKKNEKLSKPLLLVPSHFRWQLYSAVASLVNTGCFSCPIAGARKSVRLSRRTGWANDQTLNPGQEGMWTFRWKLIRPKLFLQFVYRLLSSTTDTALNFWFWWIGCRHLSPLNLASNDRKELILSSLL